VSTSQGPVRRSRPVISSRASCPALAAEAAIVALAELQGIATERQHWRKGQAATELHTRGILSTDLGPILELLSQARKDAGYEGEDPDFGDWTSEELLSTVEDTVEIAEQATHSARSEADVRGKALRPRSATPRTEEPIGYSTASISDVNSACPETFG
jgi:hypothetical protein